jgi:hypothetical protein
MRNRPRQNDCSKSLARPPESTPGSAARCGCQTAAPAKSARALLKLRSRLQPLERVLESLLKKPATASAPDPRAAARFGAIEMKKMYAQQVDYRRFALRVLTFEIIVRPWAHEAAHPAAGQSGSAPPTAPDHPSSTPAFRPTLSQSPQAANRDAIQRIAPRSLRPSRPG